MKSKILFLSKENLGGTGTFLNQSLLINKNKFKINYYFFKKDVFFNFKGKPVIINKKYPSSQNPSICKLYLFFKNLFKVNFITKNEKPDLVFACDQYSAIVVLASKMIFMQKIPIVILVGSNLFELANDKPNRLYQLVLIQTIKFFYNRAQRLIFVSNDLYKGLENKLKFDTNKTSFIRNAIDINETKTIHKKSDDNNLNLISIGRLVQPKDFETIIKAYSIINKNLPNTKLYVIGEGELKQNLEELSNKLNLSGKVIFPGWENNIFPYLAKADLFIFSSFYEGFSYVILEAMKAKVPIIATDTPYGPSEILDKGKYGILVPMGNYRKMAKEAEKLLKNLELRKKYSEKAFKRAKEFDLKKMLEQYEKLFTEVINS